MSRETEIKLRVPSAAAGRLLLKRGGFRLRKRRIVEQNTLFDTPRGALRRRGEALRIRRVGRHSTLTFKGPTRVGKYKSREEIEVEISEPQAAARILSRLGFQPAFHYGKLRSEYAGRQPGGVVMLDETPAGCFFELEGTPRWIDQVRRALGFGPEDIITATYIQLYRESEKTERKPRSAK